jgi:hypothetical protein
MEGGWFPSKTNDDLLLGIFLFICSILSSTFFEWPLARFDKDNTIVVKEYPFDHLCAYRSKDSPFMLIIFANGCASSTQTKTKNML